MKIAIVINSQRLTPELKTRLESNELKKKFDIDYDVFTPKPCDLEKTLQHLNYETYNACLVGGGDGTVRMAAQVLMDHNIPLAVLPLGTFNVLAKSLNYPNDIDEIFAIIKNKKTKQIDVAEVNGNIFLNHAWLGFYYNILKIRDKHKNIFGRSRLFKAIFAASFIFKRIPTYKFEIKIDGQVRQFKTCLLFVSNNESSRDLLTFGTRPLLATGLLHVNILNCHNRLQLIACLFALVFTDVKNSKRLTQFSVDELTVISSKDHSNTVLDGESLKIDNPLHFINHKNKLNVIVT